ncbi:MAG: ATP-binding protein, partial [Pseudonocardiales bacterium]|nr:ATP-binding protein [Pseudonocardiales bacterium]
AQAVLTERLDPDAVEPPDRVRSESGTVLDAADAVVLDLPWLAAALPGDQLVSGGDPVALAELLDLPLASEGVRAAVASTGRSIRWSELAEVVRACASIGVTVPAGELFVHDRLEIELQTPAAQRLTVPVWRDEQGSWHADDPVRALLAYLATPRTNGTFGR